MTMGLIRHCWPAGGTTTRCSYGICEDLPEAGGVHRMESGVGRFGHSRTGSASSGVSAGVAAGDDPGEMPLHRFTQHTAAVKALAWDPHVPGILATGEVRRINTSGFGTQIRRRARCSVNWTLGVR
jgi:hypothetical protein